ncbi:methylosome protein 50-like [Elysia marginata]|uniref:Methylosome protein 50-like n=1 Tax=Elysia marginata TaxID=1093978 RepID=A0AAV4ISY9_9GAST|nr:methylosome protein 50-like [Elysia marginata]
MAKSGILYQHIRVKRKKGACFCSDGGLLLGASCLTGQYWFGSLWFYQHPEQAPDVDSCTAGVQLEAGVGGAQWVDTTHVLVGLDTGGVAVWRLEDDFHTFVLSQSASGHDGVVTSVSVASDSHWAVTAAHDKCIKIWDLPSTSLIYSPKAHKDLISSVDCHPSEPDIFLSCAQDDRILLWDKRKPKPASILKKSPIQHTATCLRWQPGQPYKFAVGSESGQVALLDTRAGVDNFLTCSHHERAVYSLQFCADKPSLLASVGEDCRTVVTSVREEDDMKQIYLDTSHQDFVHGLTWPSYSKLYTCGWDAKVLCHDLDAGLSTEQGQRSSALNSQSTNNEIEDGELGSPGLTNGDISDHVSEGGDSRLKSSYSQALKPSQEISS